MFTVYSKKVCPMCVKAKSLLTAKGIDFITIEIVEDNAGDDQINKVDFISKFPGIRVVPYILNENGDSFKTYNELENHLLQIVT